MLLSLYRISCKTKRWYQNIFWHLIDLAKISAWILHFRQNGKSHKDQKSLLQFNFLSYQMLKSLPAQWIHLFQEDDLQNEEVWRHLPREKGLPKHCLSPMFDLVKSHIGQALLPTKIDADYAVLHAECNVLNARSFSVYWLIATVSLISIQNHRQMSSCFYFFSKQKSC